LIIDSSSNSTAGANGLQQRTQIFDQFAPAPPAGRTP
jgi:hypothetical protein